MFLRRQTTIGNIGSITNSGGLIKITMSGHGLTTGDSVVVADVSGTTEAMGRWIVTVVNATEFTLNESTFTNSWTGGGSVWKGDTLTVKSATAPSTPASVIAVCLYRNGSGAIVDGKSIALALSGTTRKDLVRSDPTYTTQITSVQVVSNQTATDLPITLELIDQSGVVHTYARATVEPEYTWVRSDSSSSAVSKHGKMVSAPPETP